MGAPLIRGTCKCLLDHLQIQKEVVTTSGNHAEASGEDTDQRSSVTIQSIQTKQHRSGRKCNLCSIAGDHLDGPQQFASVIPIPWPTKGAQKLVRMRLENNGARAHHFSPLAPLIPGWTNLIETTMGNRQR